MTVIFLQSTVVFCTAVQFTVGYLRDETSLHCDTVPWKPEDVTAIKFGGPGVETKARNLIVRVLDCLIFRDWRPYFNGELLVLVKKWCDLLPAGSRVCASAII